MAQYTKADLFVLHVINTPLMSQNMFIPIVELEDQSAIHGKVMDRLKQLEEEIRSEYGISFQSIIKTGNPSNEITAAAKEIKASIVVMGTHGYSPLEEIMIGSVALKVIMKSPCPTMTMTNEATHKGYNRIVLPFDLTANSKQKVNYTLGLAKAFNASVHAIAVLGEDENEYKPQMEVILHQVELLAKEKGVSYHNDVISGVKNRATAAVNYAEKVNADLIVIMTDQDVELSGFFLGPYSQQIIHQSKVPVISVRPEELYDSEDGDPLPGTSGI